jgi:hypothetical protein
MRSENLPKSKSRESILSQSVILLVYHIFPYNFGNVVRVVAVAPSPLKQDALCIDKNHSLSLQINIKPTNSLIFKKINPILLSLLQPDDKSE